MPKTESIKRPNGEHECWLIYCKGCQAHHSFDDRWIFNGDLEKPTFSPSLLVWGSKPEKRCHSFVRDGKMQYLSDCFHELAGQTVELSDID